ncbi:MAG: amino acid ABC transporter substrate-binding protein [Aquabacterium sp.]|nr:amino acid ABC transporter substrate-binding protein [Aquabacterium sp.]
MLRRAVGLIFAGLVFALGAHAQDSPTLRKIREAGVITLGYRDGSVPFSYLDSAHRPVGYSIDICQRVVDAVREHLGQPDLERRFVLVNSATRVPMVANRTVDLECGVTTHTVERQRHVAFSVTTYVAASRLVSRRSDPVRRLQDLRGRVVTSTVGTTSLAHLQRLSTEQGLAMSIVAARDDPDAFRWVENGRADAFAMDDVLLRGMIALARNPADFVVSEDALSVEPYAIMLPKGDPAFKELVDRAIVAMFRRGEVDALYRRWFESAIPPGGVNLSLPMLPAMRRVIEQPTDTPDPAHYR